jgi:hypothetical protein
VTKIAWDRSGERFYEVGVDHGVFYPKVGNGVPWNGLVSVNDTSSGGEPTPSYIDGYKYQNRSGPEEFTATLEAFTYPPEFAVCDGTASLGRGLYATQQPRASFGLSYRTLIGNDLAGTSRGYKLHLVYNALATASERNYATVGEDPQPITMSWDLSVKPIRLVGRKPVQHLIIDSTMVDTPLLATLETILYGSVSSEARLPTPSEVVALFTGFPSLFVSNNGDGTFTISGPDDIVKQIDARTFQVISETAVSNANGTYDVTSY